MISNSRKMRDMYSGSFLLSYLMQEVILKLKEKDNVKIIIPYVEKHETQSLNIPNKVIARVEGFNQEEKNNFGSEIERFIQEKFIAICQKVLEKVKAPFNREIQNQLTHFLEIYWLFEDNNDNSDDIATYIKAVNKMHSVKNLRCFNQIDEDAGRKCSLYPDNNAIFYREKANKNIPDYMNYENSIKISDKEYLYSLKVGESLSAFAYVKRMFHTIENKEALGYKLKISSVAYMLLKSRIGDLQNLTDESCEALMDLYNRNTPSEDNYPEEQIKRAKKLYAENKNVKITPYYAILKLDGDNMGDAYNKCKTYDKQNELSMKTSSFVSVAQDIAEDNNGLCIFAGGEDILMFLPIDTLFTAVYTLYKKYRETLGYNFTFSAGIVIAHFMQPLKDVMVQVYEAEKEAKDYCAEKNSFAINLIKRGGGSVSVANRFGDKCENLKAVEDVVKNLYGEDLSHNYLYNLISNLKKITVNNETVIIKNKMINALIFQANKIKNRDNKNEVSKCIVNLFEIFGNLKQFTDSLKIIDFLSKEGIYSDI
ncbi:MAG: type III-B CRISPR-associated protein Cas10/Cmr2 [Clostridiales bacterium]|nr:type III-B CRISPR-associated protein Cas10/Cmr2 [Clostridiales bacterium]